MIYEYYPDKPNSYVTDIDWLTYLINVTRELNVIGSVHSPHGARVSGVVEETPGRLEYEVALYKEAPARLTNMSHNSELPVDQAVPIGTKLQLRARINPHSGMDGNYRQMYTIIISLRRIRLVKSCCSVNCTRHNKYTHIENTGWDVVTSLF